MNVNVYATLDVVMDAQLCGHRLDRISMKLITEVTHARGIELLEGIVAMLTKMT